jgi:hypothetical protein
MHKEGRTARKRFWSTMFSRNGGLKKKKTEGTVQRIYKMGTQIQKFYYNNC